MFSCGVCRVPYTSDVRICCTKLHPNRNINVEMTVENDSRCSVKWRLRCIDCLQDDVGVGGEV
jgi:hypothetical protein